MLTSAQVRAIFPDASDPITYAAVIGAAWDRFGFTSKSARAAWCGVVGNETGGLRQIGREDMRYSADRAFQLFPKARANPDVTRDRCASVPVDKGRRFASWIYADLYGNGPEATEDGWRYRGGGMTQLTFRSAYRACGEAIGIDLEADPDLIATPEAAALSSCWFMAEYKPAILRYFNRETEGDFLAGAALVGWTNEHHTAVRLGFRAKALAVLDGAQPVDVAALQRALMAAGYDLPKYGADGDLGLETRTAIQRFQRANGLQVTGSPDKVTLAKLGVGVAA